jgi:Osmosensitive K+ channel histidine kinase
VLSDIVAQITKIMVRETVPDTILERANEIELVDITPEELIERFHEGKVMWPRSKGRKGWKISLERAISLLYANFPCA